MKLLSTIIVCLMVLPCGVLAEPSPPKIVARAEWKAAEPRTALMRRQEPKEIVVHHTGEPQRASLSIERKLRNLQDFSFRPGRVGAHAKPAWGDVPYHYYIDLHGRVAEGRDIQYAGDTNTGYDTLNLIQIVVEGNFEKERPAREQLEALKELISWLSEKYRIDPHLVFGHGDKAKTDCPGKYLKPYIATLRTGPQNR
ncbi:MAG: peptidoglycan recognition family protein [Rhodomicrobium sp.]